MIRAVSLQVVGYTTVQANGWQEDRGRRKESNWKTILVLQRCMNTYAHRTLDMIELRLLLI